MDNLTLVILYGIICLAVLALAGYIGEKCKWIRSTWVRCISNCKSKVGWKGQSGISSNLHPVQPVQQVKTVMGPERKHSGLNQQ